MANTAGMTDERGYLVGIMMRVAWKFLGLPYKWGGDDPLQEFDCSGFVIELLKTAGLLPRGGDWTAHSLWEKFQEGLVKLPYQGCLVFWERPADGRVIHVEVCIDDKFSIGASGGGSKSMTIEDAIQQNAYIKIRPFRSRPHIAGFIDPFKKEEEDGSS